MTERIIKQYCPITQRQVSIRVTYCDKPKRKERIKTWNEIQGDKVIDILAIGTIIFALIYIFM